MLDSKTKEQLRAYLQHLREPIEIRLTVGDDDKSRELRGLAEDIAALSPLVTLGDEPAGGDRTPLMAVLSPARGTRIEFAGVPLGHEFTSLVLALLHTGGHPPKVDDDLLRRMDTLEGDFRFEIFVSLSCQTCPDVVQAINTLAARNPAVRPVMIDGALFQEEVERRDILAVPTVYLNGEPFAQGRLALPAILARLDDRGTEHEAAALSARTPYDMLVVGGGPAAASAAIYAARKGLRTGVVAETFGGQLLETLGIENFISVKATEGPTLAAQLEEHVRHYDVDIMSGQRAQRLDARDADGLLGIELANGARLRARSVVLATGARWRQINVPGEAEYKGRGVAYCPHCDGPLFKDKRVAVIGGGNSGVEAAIDLAGIAEHVTVLEFDDALRADQVLTTKLRTLPNVDVHTAAQTTAIEGDGSRVNALVYTDRHSGESHRIELAGVFVQIGLAPNTDFLAETIELTPRGEIIVGPRNETSLPGVFAAGDATDSPYKQIIIAMGSGATAALGAFEWLMREGEGEPPTGEEGHGRKDRKEEAEVEAA